MGPWTPVIPVVVGPYEAGGISLTTLATSAPPGHSLQGDEQMLSVEEGASVHVTVELNEAAANHLRTHASQSTVSINVQLTDPASAAGGLRVVPDDDAFPPQDGPSSFVLGADACPAEGACMTGVTVEAIEGTQMVTVFATAFTEGDGSLLFPSDRSYPEDAAITYTID
ncbi:MAG: hypothetical protein AB7S26_34475 [Sandaracinaceae bacterium]